MMGIHNIEATKNALYIMKQTQETSRRDDSKSLPEPMLIPL